jgi:hypothetical protein
VPSTKPIWNELPAVRATLFLLNSGVVLLLKQQESCWPATGVTVALRLTVPAKLPKLLKTMVETADPPLMTTKAAGIARMVKSWPGTVTVMLALLELPLMPVTVRV